MLDPQQRLALEAFACAQAQDVSLLARALASPATAPWPIEAAGLSGSSTNGSRNNVGVYVGCSQLEYAQITLQQQVPLTGYYATGAHLSVSSGRVSYTFGGLLSTHHLWILQHTCEHHLSCVGEHKYMHVNGLYRAHGARPPSFLQACVAQQ